MNSAPPRQGVVHLGLAVDDEVDRRAQPLARRQLRQKTAARHVGVLLVPHHDQQVVVAEIAPDRVPRPSRPGRSCRRG